MKFIYFVLIPFTLLSNNFSHEDGPDMNKRIINSFERENWYICSYCCKTKKATSTPWLQGCRVSSSGTHNFTFVGIAGDYNYTCQYCDAEVYLTSSTSPSASKCCSSNSSTHSWVHK